MSRAHPRPVDAAVRAPRQAGGRRFVSLFSGAGGLDQGLCAAGWTGLAQVECAPDCAATLRLTAERERTRTEVVASRIEEVPAAVLRRSLGLRRGELDLLAGGPPCQPFTTSGLRQSILDRRASSLFPAYLEFVREFGPRALLLENVDGMLSAALRHRPLDERGGEHPALAPDEQKGSFLRWLVDELVALGYAVAWGVAEAADHGVAQFRQRAILIGVRGDAPCFLPAPQYGRDGLPPYRDLRWALAGVRDRGPVQPLSARKCDVYRLVPAGGNWRDLPVELQRATMGAAFHAEGGKSGWWRRLSWAAPAPTILGMPDHSSTALIHPDEVRCLSVHECAAVQSFGHAMRFAGSPRSQYQQIGNAVPPLLARALGAHLARFLDGEPQPAPDTAMWRKASANRRIGTHGWAVRRRLRTAYQMNVAVRPDHVWSTVQADLCLA